MKKKVELISGMLLIIGSIVLAYLMGRNPEVEFWAGLVAGGIIFLVCWFLASIMLANIEGKLDLEKKKENFLIALGFVLFSLWSFFFGFIITKLGGIVVSPVLWEKVCRAGTFLGMASIVGFLMYFGVRLLRAFASTDEFP